MGKGGKKGSGKISDKGSGKGEAKGSKGASKGGKDSGKIPEALKGGIDVNSRLSGKPYKADVEDVLATTTVRPADFDQKAIQLLDYHHKNGGRAGDALKFLKEAASGVERESILNSRAYVYALLRKFDEGAYKEMKALTGGEKPPGERQQKKEATAASATADASARVGDASSRQPPGPPPLQDYLAQVGFNFGGKQQSAQQPQQQPPQQRAGAPELSAEAPEFSPGQTWNGSMVGATPTPLPPPPPYPCGCYPGASYPAVAPPYSPYPSTPAYPGYPYPTGYAGYPGYPPAPYQASPFAGVPAPPMPPAGLAAAVPVGGKHGGKRGGRGKGDSKGDKAQGEGKGGRSGKAVEKTESAEAPHAGGMPPKWSVGSQGHDQHQCKPCAFYHTKGCSSGENCQFCHMCGPGEKKKRKKETTMGKTTSKDEDEPETATPEVPAAEPK